MKRWRNYMIGIDPGEIAMFSDFENGGPVKGLESGAWALFWG